MALPTLAIPGFDALSHTVNLANSGRQAATDSSAVVLSTEDLAAINAIATALAGTLTVTANVGTGTQAVSGTVTANIGTGTLATVTTVSTVTNLAQFGGAAINLGAGAVGTGTLRITQASDSPVVTALGSSSSAVVANGAAGDIAGYLRTIKDAATDTSTPSPVKIDQTTDGTTNAVSVRTPADVLSFTPTLDTSAYASGDVLFATVTLGTVTRVNDGRAVLMSLTGIDKSKNKPAMTLLFYQTNVTSAAANAANALSDADQANLLGYVRILAADWIDYANNSIVCKTSINLLLEAASGAQNVYAVGILDAGTPTFAASDLVFKLGFVQS